MDTGKKETDEAEREPFSCRSCMLGIGKLVESFNKYDRCEQVRERSKVSKSQANGWFVSRCAPLEELVLVVRGSANSLFFVHAGGLVQQPAPASDNTNHNTRSTAVVLIVDLMSLEALAKRSSQHRCPDTI